MITFALLALGAAGLAAAWRYTAVSGRRDRAMVVTAISLSVMGYAVFGVLGLAGGVVPIGAIRILQAKKVASDRRRLRDATPEAFEGLADAIRAKGSLRLGVAEMATAGPAATRRAFARVQTQLEAGFELASAIGALEGELQSEEAREGILAMRLHLASGGNLPESLELVAERARDGLSVERELAAMTAQGRLSGLVMALAAPGFAFATYAIGLGGGFLVRSPVGLGVLASGLLLDVGGYLWIRRICEVRW